MDEKKKKENKLDEEINDENADHNDIQSQQGFSNEENEESNEDDSTNSDDSELERLKKERDEYIGGWKRANADFMNYKKDESNRIKEVVSLANKHLIKELLVVLDSFSLAINSLNSAGNNKEKAEEKGIYLIQAQMQDILKKFGLEKIDISVGDRFNPAIHEAIALVDSDKYEEGSVLEEMESGYKYNGKVLRPAKVKVVK